MKNNIMKNNFAKSNIVNNNIERYFPDYKTGLNNEQVHNRKKQGLFNREVKISYKSNKNIIIENTFTYFNFIFLVLAILLILAGSYRNLTFIPIIVANTVIGIIQEIKAKKILQHLKMLNAPKSEVIRDGTVFDIKTEDLVLDDVVILSAGNQVGADGIVLDGQAQVNEALLTGESDEIIKKPGDKIFSGSYVVSGKCHIRLDKVGKESYISKLTQQAKTIDSKEQSEMIRSLNKIVKFAGIAVIPIGFALFLQAYFFNNAGFSESITSMVAAILGMIPEGLYLLATITLTVSAMRLAGQKVLLHNMKCIETLARVNVICIDKTGTITENEMKVHDIVFDDKNDEDKEHILKKMSDFMAVMDNDNNTIEALKSYFQTLNIPLANHYSAINKKGFSPITKFSCAEFDDGVYILGAPEFILKSDYEKYKDQIDQYGSKGERVLAFGLYDSKFPEGMLEKPIKLLAFILLKNEIRENAVETFRYFEENGVEIKVISGDNPVTVAAVAKEAAIPGSQNYVDASKVDENDIDEWVNNTVFGRVTPERKRQIVRKLKEQGKTVAMVGDGVNDILALKEADCSIAMKSGSKAAAQVSQIVLLNSDFSKMPDIVLEGRRVVNNIQRSAVLFLTKNVFSLLLAIISIISFITYPFEPNQISLISMFTIGIPGFLLAQEKSNKLITGNFIRNVLVKAIPAGMTDVLCVVLLLLSSLIFKMSINEISTTATFLLAVVGIMILYKVTAPINYYGLIVMALCIVGGTLCGFYFNWWFDLNMISFRCFIIFLVLAGISIVLFNILQIIAEKISMKYPKK